MKPGVKQTYILIFFFYLCTWISSASTDSEGTETEPMTKLFTSRAPEGRAEGVAPPVAELGGRVVGGSL